MSKIVPALAEYAKILATKNLPELKLISKSLTGTIINGSKASIITGIINRAQKNKAIQAKLQNYLLKSSTKPPPITNTPSSLPSSLSPPSSPSLSSLSFQPSSSPPQPQSLPQPQLPISPNPQRTPQKYEKPPKKGIPISIHQQIIQNYCKASAGVPLCELLLHQNIPFDDQYFKKIKQIYKMKEHQLLEEVGEEENGEGEEGDQKEEEKGQEKGEGLRQNRKLYLINDLVKNPSKEQIGLKTILNRLNIQNQLIYPSYQIQRSEQTTLQTLHKTIPLQDNYTINNYINNNLQKRIKIHTKKSQIRYNIYSATQAIQYMGIIKEQNYNDPDFIVHLLSFMEVEGGGDDSGNGGGYGYGGGSWKGKGKKMGNVQVGLQFYRVYQRFAQYYQGVFATISTQVRMTLIKQIMKSGQTQLKFSTTNFNRYFMPNLLNLGLKLCQIQLEHSDQTEGDDPSSSIVQISKNMIELWIKCCENVTVSSTQQLKLFLQGLKQIDQLLVVLQPQSPQIPQTYNTPSYTTITTQILYSVQTTLSSNPTTSIIEPQVLNTILTNFETVFNAHQLTPQVVEKCVMNGWSLRNKLGNQGRKCLVRLLGRREVIGVEVVGGGVVEGLLGVTVGLDLKEVLIAIQLVNTYKLYETGDRIITNLILHNIDPAQLQPDIKKYLIKILQERTQYFKQVSTQQFLINYLQ